MNFSAIKDGTTNLAIDTSLLKKVTGLDFTGVENTVEISLEELLTGLDITKESNFKFDAPEFAQFLLDAGLAADDFTGAVTGDMEEKVTETDLALVQDGTTSVALDVDTLSAAAGLTLSNAENTVEPVSEDFAVGFDITEESDFRFTTEDGFTPVGGEIEHTGTITFDSAAGDIIVGDFTVGFDAERQTDDISGFFVQNTVEGAVPDGAILFDVGNPDSLETTDMKLNLGSADLFVSSEFAQILLDTGLATDNLTGADVGDVAINAITESDF